jgi:hypothetical protein
MLPGQIASITQKFLFTINESALKTKKEAMVIASGACGGFSAYQYAVRTNFIPTSREFVIMFSAYNYAAQKSAISS